MSQEDSPQLSPESQKLEMLGRLSGNVFHDLNNYLTIIQLNAAILEAGGLSEDDVTKALREILHAANGASQLTKGALSLVRRQKSEMRPLEIRRMLRELAGMLEVLVAKRSTITLDTESEELWVTGDRSSLNQLFMNLILNAADACPRTGIRISVGVVDLVDTAGEQRKFVEILVRDDGQGIDRDVLPHVFEEHYTTKPEGKGTGLGLHIVSKIVTDHGGVINVESQPGWGATFHVCLPQIVRESRPVRGSKSANGITILLVEDDPGIRALTARLLEAEGYRILEASDANSGMSIWVQHHEQISLVFADVVLPGELTGVEMARRMAMEKSSLKVIHASGFGWNTTKDNPACDAVFLSKPFPPDTLIQTVKAVLTALPPDEV